MEHSQGQSKKDEKSHTGCFQDVEKSLYYANTFSISRMHSLRGGKAYKKTLGTWLVAIQGSQPLRGTSA